MATRPTRRVAMSALALALALGGGAGAAEIYRWVDEQGRTHFGDRVPERYRSRAVRVDTPAPPTPEEAQAAQERLERLKRQAEAAQPASPAASAPPPAASAPAPLKRPPTGVTPDTDCATWRRLYRESVECFGPYRTARGGVKPEAFEHCTSIPDPAPTCGRTWIRP